MKSSGSDKTVVLRSINESGTVDGGFLQVLIKKRVSGGWRITAPAATLLFPASENLAQPGMILPWAAACISATSTYCRVK